MNERRSGQPPGGSDADARDASDQARARRGRRSAVFGEVLPEETGDDRGESWGDAADDGEEWLRRQVPPHHG